MDNAQIFWDAFRRRWRWKLAAWEGVALGKRGGEITHAWTEMLKQAAEEACKDCAVALDREVIIEREGHGRLDVFAEDRHTGKLIVAFESELAYWGYGSSGKDWRQEFPKLCGKAAELRVL